MTPKEGEGRGRGGEKKGDKGTVIAFVSDIEPLKKGFWSCSFPPSFQAYVSQLPHRMKYIGI